jgi:hypothetical protein
MRRAPAGRIAKPVFQKSRPAPPALPIPRGRPIAAAQAAAAQADAASVARNAAAATANSSSKPARRGPTMADAPTIRRWLKPQTLRAQFILTEVFQPPLALRSDRQ